MAAHIIDPEGGSVSSRVVGIIEADDFRALRKRYITANCWAVRETQRASCFIPNYRLFLFPFARVI
jgi:hypothetical protein